MSDRSAGSPLQRHAVLGLGGVGGLIATLLSAGGHSVTAIVRSDPNERMDVSLERPDGTIVRGTIRSVTALDGEVDVLWVAPKATQLRDALHAVASLRPSLVVPLLNGIDHMSVLRDVFGNDVLVPATISVETEKLAPGRFRQSSPFINLTLAHNAEPALAPATHTLAGFGVDVRYIDDEQTLLWSKLVFLAPLALATSAAGEPLGFVRDTPEWRERLEAAVREVAAVALACGASVEAHGALELIGRANPGMRSSMQKDVEAGREPELDAIGGTVLRAAQAHGIPVPTIEDLIERTRARVAARAASSS